MEKLPSVLLVDDDATTNFLNELLLKRLGVADHICVVTDGEQALALLTQPAAFQPTLLLLDVKMPVMDGIEFLRAYQQLPPSQQASTVVVMLTTSMAAADLSQLQCLPAVDIINKPLNREKVDALLRKHFGRQLAEA
ncbi:MAG: response regulator [Hymenobacter sp.]|nr:MAG: response regulator [Hymenobacter sp.]